jgi:hypothetical protein
MTDVARDLERGRRGCAEALELFDGLDVAELDFMLGTWRGAEFPTGHPMDGMLTAAGWYGKRFVDPETVHPLLFHTADHRAVFAVEPALCPVGLRLPTGRGQPYHRLITAARPLLGTRKPRARLRMVEHRGRATATMIYDAKPINDVFRRVDDDTVLGLMDYRKWDRPYFFLLHREHEPVVMV